MRPVNRFTQWVGIVGVMGSVLLGSTGVSWASSGPTFYPGETVDVFTLPGYGTTGLSISLFSNDGGAFNYTLPLTYIGPITGNFTPDFATQDGFNWGTTWAEYSFRMPTGATANQQYSALINTSTGGAVFTRFVGYPNPTQAYGTTFTDEAVPTGQLPEVPYAGAIPLVAMGLGGVWVWRRQRQRVAVLRATF